MKWKFKCTDGKVREYEMQQVTAANGKRPEPVEANNVADTPEDVESIEQSEEAEA